MPELLRDEEVIVRREGALGRLTLNRPRALNALNIDMIRTIREYLDAWAYDLDVACVMFDASGDKAFCAGGDIRFMYETGRENPEPGRQFWREEYSVNLLISRYPKPVVTIMDGITMGGGVGLASHASHRVVTEKALVAMPEATIGFLPDVGGTHLLARAPGKIGLYLGTTSGRMNAGDAIFAGFADAFVPSQSIDELRKKLASGQPPLIALAALSRMSPSGDLADLRAKIDLAFSRPTMLACLHAIEALAAGGDEWAIKTAKAMRHNCPFSLAAIFEALQQADHLDLEGSLKLEYRFSHRTLSHDDYYEGVRSVIVDKDRDPRWHPARLEDVDLDQVSAMLSPLGDSEWEFT